MTPRIVSLALALAGLLISTAAAQADKSPDPRRLLPESTLVYAEAQPGALVARAADPALWAELEKVDQVQAALTSPQYVGLRFVVGLLEARLKVKWPEAATDLTAGGVYAALDADNSVIVVARTTKPELLKELHEAIVELMALDAANKGQPSQAKSEDYRGVTGWSFGPREAHAILGDTLIVSNRSEALKAAIDRTLDPAQKSLLDVPEFVRDRAALDATEVVWARARLATLRNIPQVAAGLSAKSDNPLAELLLGGVADTLKHAATATASLHLDSGGLTLRTQLPRDPELTAASRAWCFCSGGGGAPPLLRPRGTIASLSAHRDLSGLWLARDELFNDAVRTGLTQADSGLSLFFAGRDFGSEVLGEISSGVRLVVAAQDFSDGQPVPAIRLPAEALIVRLNNPEAFAPRLLVAFQSVIGATNLNAAQQGRPQFLLSNADHQGVAVWQASYLTEPETPTTAAPIVYNFSPACARYQQYFVFGTTASIVRDCLDALAAEASGASPAATSDNFRLEVDAQAASAALAANRDLLSAQQMLTQGRTADEAAQRVSAALDLLGKLNGGRIKLTDGPDSLMLEVSLGAAP